MFFSFVLVAREISVAETLTEGLGYAWWPIVFAAIISIQPRVYRFSEKETKAAGSSWDIPSGGEARGPAVRVAKPFL